MHATGAIGVDVTNSIVWQFRTRSMRSRVSRAIADAGSAVADLPSQHSSVR
jgi:hypothetical protein